MGFKWEVWGGPSPEKQYLHFFEILEVIPQKKLSHTWLFDGYEGHSILTYELFAKGKKTKLKLTHSGIESFPQTNPDFSFENFAIGWTHLINTSLYNFLNQKNDMKNDMKNDLLFDFTIDKAAKTVFINREFDAELPLVWDAFTKPEILDQWVAPKPWTSKTKHMKFEVGGRRFYAMVSPEGQEHWSIQKYTAISPKTNFKMWNAFADKEENPQLPGSEWDYNFSEQNGITKVNITIYNESLERLEKMIEMGFQGGFTMSMKNLEEVLAILSKK